MQKNITQFLVVPFVSVLLVTSFGLTRAQGSEPSRFGQAASEDYQVKIASISPEATAIGACYKPGLASASLDGLIGIDLDKGTVTIPEENGGNGKKQTAQRAGCTGVCFKLCVCLYGSDQETMRYYCRSTRDPCPVGSDEANCARQLNFQRTNFGCK